MKDDLDGFYLDDGTKIDPSLVPKPSLCVLCAKDDDLSEYTVCTMTRIDQMDDDEFECNEYQPRTVTEW